MPRKLSRNAVQEHVLLTLSEFSPMGHRAYAELFGLHPAAAFERLRRMWDARQLYVERYERNTSGKPVPFYAIGSLPDAIPPEALPVSEKVRKYQATPKGQAMVKKARKRHDARIKKRRETDPSYAEAQRAYQRQWSQRKYGHQPRRRLVEVERFDPILARMMGIKVKEVA